MNRDFLEICKSLLAFAQDAALWSIQLNLLLLAISVLPLDESSPLRFDTLNPCVLTASDPVSLRTAACLYVVEKQTIDHI